VRICDFFLKLIASALAVTDRDDNKSWVALQKDRKGGISVNSNIQVNWTTLPNIPIPDVMSAIGDLLL
jgi:hypothetical protein